MVLTQGWPPIACVRFVLCVRSLRRQDSTSRVVMAVVCRYQKQATVLAKQRQICSQDFKQQYAWVIVNLEATNRVLEAVSMCAAAAWRWPICVQWFPRHGFSVADCVRPMCAHPMCAKGHDQVAAAVSDAQQRCS